MTTDELLGLVRDIVDDAFRLSVKRTSEHVAPVNYACVFTQSADAYEETFAAAKLLGRVVTETTTGPVFLIRPIPTDAGDLRILKIRKPDPKRRERGDADFTVPDYESFKGKHVGTPGFSVIVRPEMEMVELLDPSSDVLVYYSHPTLGEVLGLAM
ncbi:MAG: hypothetical protein HGA38_00320 [Candidatus Moranbacteria bacterium]|nr:hypothetical protein [Candidatus Moranbacteria bacterium]NTW45980.1 hypothetical protein [Candidatus Moranbacteria bacterium]